MGQAGSPDHEPDREECARKAFDVTVACEV